MIGGVLDFYFLSGPTPNKVIEQYGALVGLPTWQPVWGFGFHLCRYVTLMPLCTATSKAVITGGDIKTLLKHVNR